MAMATRAFLALLLALASPLAPAATSGQPTSPVNASVAGGETQVFSARFFDAFGRPAVGETVRFSNDACGTFPNGGFFIDVAADATGQASTTFRAFNQGITCWLIAAAGVEVRFDVLTYVASSVYLAATTNPGQPRPGQSFTVTAAAKVGIYNLYEADIAARIVPGTASATISPAGGNSGQQGSVTFGVAPDNRIGDYEIEFQFRDRVQRLAVKASSAPWQDLWWAGLGENGWGMSIVQHRDMLFSVIYAYDAGGKSTWYVFPGGQWNEARTAFTGALYVPRGAPFTAYDAARFVVGSPVGSATLTFTDASNAVLDYSINGTPGRKNITRQLFGPPTAAVAPSFGDMWWGGVAQNGWGIAVLQQHFSLFAVWFTYGESGAPTWFVMPAGTWADASTYEGRIYRASGSPWLGAVYDARDFKTTDAGSFRIRFAGDGATLEYTIDGRSGTIALSRNAF
ncbi:MAG: hypothetical protein ACXWBK_06370 [Usitatibacter sp.]